MTDLHKMAGDAIPLNVPSKYEGMTIQWRDTFPDNEFPACPFQPPQVFPEQRGKTLNITRVFHPCVQERCAVWNYPERQCGAKR